MIIFSGKLNKNIQLQPPVPGLGLVWPGLVWPGPDGSLRYVQPEMMAEKPGKCGEENREEERASGAPCCLANKPHLTFCFGDRDAAIPHQDAAAAGVRCSAGGERIRDRDRKKGLNFITHSRKWSIVVYLSS